VVLRVPGEAEHAWCVIDSCAIAGTNPAKRLLERYDARISLLAISHPHDDHAVRFAELIPTLAHDAKVGAAWPRLPDESWEQSLSARRHHLKGSAEAAIASIHQCWQRAPARQWEMSRGQSVPVGACTIEVLNPDTSAHAAGFPAETNRLSTALLVAWKGCRILLGGDVEKDDWTAIQSSGRRVAHHGCKVPHHGSDGAWHQSWMVGGAACGWCITPWHAGQLPWSTPSGIQGLLSANRPLHVTSGVGMNGVPSGCPVQQHPSGPSPATQQLAGGMTLAALSVPQDVWANYVALGFDAQGSLQDQQFGDGSISVG
jgi:hypothetical protein